MASETLHVRAKRSLWDAELAIRERAGLPLPLDQALDYLDLLAEQRPERAERAGLRWVGRLCVEAQLLTMREAQMARSPPSPTL